MGKVKETVGRAMDDDEIEFKGKVQTIKADIENKVENIKEEVFDKTNDFIDKVNQNKKHKD
jgi:uncharacterized protein YjbJ (UPF0337 family)